MNKLIKNVYMIFKIIIVILTFLLMIFDESDPNSELTLGLIVLLYPLFIIDGMFVKSGSALKLTFIFIFIFSSISIIVYTATNINTLSILSVILINLYLLIPRFVVKKLNKSDVILKNNNKISLVSEIKRSTKNTYNNYQVETPSKVNEGKTATNDSLKTLIKQKNNQI